MKKPTWFSSYDFRALFKRISSVTRFAVTDGEVVNNRTFGIEAASVGTGVNTFLVNASFSRSTFSVKDTFRSTT